MDFRTDFLWVSYRNGGDNVLIMQISGVDNELAHPWVKFKTFYQKMVCQAFHEVKLCQNELKLRPLSNLVMPPLINYPHYDNKSCDLSHINKRYHNLLSHASKLHPIQTNEFYAKCLKCNVLQSKREYATKFRREYDCIFLYKYFTCCSLLKTALY